MMTSKLTYSNAAYAILILVNIITIYQFYTDHGWPSFPAIHLVSPVKLSTTGAVNITIDDYFIDLVPDTASSLKKLVQTDKTYRFEEINTRLSDILAAECKDNNRIPNVVHYGWLENHTFGFVHYVAVLSVYKRINPCYIVFHGDITPQGKWWDRTMVEVKRVLLEYRPKPIKIFSKELTRIEHSYDIMRLEVLIKHGGIYLDTDIIALKNFDELRGKNVTVQKAMKFNQIYGINAVVVAKPQNPLLKMWYLSYNDYREDLTYNSVTMLYKLMRLIPNIVSAEPKNKFMTDKTGPLDNITSGWRSDAYSQKIFVERLNNKDIEFDSIKTGKDDLAVLCRLALYESKDEVKS